MNAATANCRTHLTDAEVTALTRRAETAEAELRDASRDVISLGVDLAEARHQLDALQPLITAAKTWREHSGRFGRYNDERALVAAVDALPPSLGSPADRKREG